MSELEQVSCSLCGSDDYEEFIQSWDMWSEDGQRENQRFSYVRCNSCSLVFMNPRVPMNDMNKYYQSNYVAHDLTRNRSTEVNSRDTTLISVIHRLVGSWSSLLRNLFRLILSRFAIRERAYNDLTDFDAISRPTANAEIKEFSCSEGVVNSSISKLGPHLNLSTVKSQYDPLNINGSGLKLLDIGCGTGKYLLEKRDHDWDVFGVEPNRAAVILCRDLGLKVLEGYFDLDDWGLNYFDAVTLIHVIEHLPEPEKTIRDAFLVLKPGGIIYIRTPNVASLTAKIFRGYWIGVDAPRHYYLFSMKTLKRIVTESGFTKLIGYTAYSSTSGITGALEFILREKFRISFERDTIRKNMILRYLALPIVRLTDHFGIGDHLHFLAIKPTLGDKV